MCYKPLNKALCSIKIFDSSLTTWLVPLKLNIEQKMNLGLIKRTYKFSAVKNSFIVSLVNTR